MTRDRSDTIWTQESERWYFGAFFVFGAAFILVLKEWLGGQLLATAIPCSLMVGYAALVWDFAEKRPRSDAAGDNLYYLGFLYTLTSLGHSLFRFNVEAEDSADIVTNFGIAISTTILGMMLRVLLGRPGADDPASIEASVRLDLTDSARSLRDEIDYTVREFGDLRKKFALALEETVAESLQGVSSTFGHVRNVQGLIENFEKDMRQVTGALSHQARALGQRADDIKLFETAVAELHGRIGATVRALGNHADTLDTGAHALSEALRTQTARIQEADFLQALVDHAGAAVATEIGATTDKFSTLLDQMRDADNRREQALAASRRATTELREALEENRRLSAASADAVRTLHQVVAKFEAAGEQISRFDDSVHAVARELIEASRGVVAKMESTGEQISRFNDSARTVTRELGSAGTDSVQFRERVRAATEELARITTALTKWSRKLEEAPRPAYRRPLRRWLVFWRR